MLRHFIPVRKAALTAVVLSLCACAAIPPDGGQGAVRELVQQRGGLAIPDVPPAQREQHIATLLAAPLTVDNAVNIALLNNRSLQAGYAELGIAYADLAQAGRIANPVISFGRIKGPHGGEIERTLTLPVMGLLLMPITRPLEQRRLEQAQARTAIAALRVADDTRRAYFGALAAHQSADYMEQVKTAAEASAELALRMAQAGNWSKLQQAREQAFYADSVAQLARARQARLAEREKLARLMGLSATTAIELPERMPDLPAAPRDIQDAEAEAMGNRLDVLMAQKELAGLKASLGLTRTTRFVNLLDLSYLHNTDEEGHRLTGYEIELQIPLFDFGGARVARAEAMYMQAVQRASAAAIDARSQVRVSYSAYRTAYDLARHYTDEIVPLKRRISDEQLLRYNGMLISVFELLADAREQVASVNASIDAQRDFWIAESALQAAMNGSASDSGAPAMGANAAPAASAAASH